MSYCRWSSDNFACDVYCYADVSGGYTTHVAGNKAVGSVPKVPPFPAQGSDEGTVKRWAAEYAEASRIQMAFLESCERRPIGLPHDGKTFSDGDLDDFLARLEYLKKLGYNVPDWAIASVREELADDIHITPPR